MVGYYQSQRVFQGVLSHSSLNLVLIYLLDPVERMNQKSLLFRLGVVCFETDESVSK
jgi:hypothetical protein